MRSPGNLCSDATRRTCASLLAALDVYPRVAMQILRHSHIAVTMDVYIEVSSDLTRCVDSAKSSSDDDCCTFLLYRRNSARHKGSNPRFLGWI